MRRTDIPSHHYHLKWLIIVIAFVLCVGIISNRVWDLPTPLERLDLYIVDTVIRMRKPQTPIAPIVIVAIDDESFNYTGYHWPWKRDYLAQIIHKINEGNPKVIVFDIFLFEPDQEPSGDETLVREFREARAVVGLINILRSENRETLQLPIDPYPAVFGALGLAGIVADNDAVIRSVQAYDYSEFDDKTYFHWGIEAVRLYTGGDTPLEYRSDFLILNGQKVPLSKGRLLVHFIGPPATFPYYSAYQVALGDIPAEMFKDKIVIVGATTITLQDLYSVPTGVKNRMPGVEIGANVINTLLSGQFRKLAPPVLEILGIIFCGVLIYFLCRNRQPITILMMLVAGVVVYSVIWLVLYLYGHFQVSLFSPLVMLICGASVPAIEKILDQEFEKRRIQKLFSHFVSAEIISQLIKTPDALSLNKRAKLSILFADIRNFTTLSEKLSPDEVVGLLNPYLSVMTAVIHQHGGTVDKYIGDAIVAFFGEPIQFPDHAKRAARAALDMRKALDGLRSQWKEEGKFEGDFDIGIGIHIGDVFVGMIGSQQRLNYTVIGDAVNTASRLQEQTKFHNFPILISQQMVDLLGDDFITEYVEERAFKGKVEMIKIYKLIGTRSISS